MAAKLCMKWNHSHRFRVRREKKWQSSRVLGNLLLLCVRRAAVAYGGVMSLLLVVLFCESSTLCWCKLFRPMMTLVPATSEGGYVIEWNFNSHACLALRSGDFRVR